MLKSLEKSMQIKENYPIYPGHGLSATLKAEERITPYWIEHKYAIHYKVVYTYFSKLCHNNENKIFN